MNPAERLRSDAEYAFAGLREALDGVAERHAWARLPEVGRDFLHTDASIQGIVLHVATGKRMYASAGFRGLRTRWREVVAQLDAFEPNWDASLRYLDECHADWMDAWAGLRDEDLETPRSRPQGDAWPAWRILQTVIHHDAYHAGQVALLRYAAGESDVPPPKYADDVRRSAPNSRAGRRSHIKANEVAAERPGGYTLRMQYRPLGRTGVQVSVACLGTMTFGAEPDWGSDEAQSRTILDEALDQGVNFLDTADVYGRGASESILGRILGARRDRIVLATKGYNRMDDADPNAMGNSYRHLVQACEASLRRLQTDRIDLYQLHRPQPSVPIDETLRALDQLRRQGKILYAGTSNFGAWQACEARYVAREMGVASFVSEQPPYNLLDRRIERDVLPFCRTYDVAVIPWSPLAGGILSGKYLEPAPGGRYRESDYQDRRAKQPVEKLGRLKALAEANGLTLATLSLAWVAAQPGVTAPIVGARSPEQLRGALSAVQTPLSDETLRAVDALFAPGDYDVPYSVAALTPNARI